MDTTLLLVGTPDELKSPRALKVRWFDFISFHFVFITFSPPFGLVGSEEDPERNAPTMERREGNDFCHAFLLHAFINIYINIHIYTCIYDFPPRCISHWNGPGCPSPLTEFLYSTPVLVVHPVFLLLRTIERSLPPPLPLRCHWSARRWPHQPRWPRRSHRWPSPSGWSLATPPLER